MGAKRVLFLDDRSKRVHAAFKKYAPPDYDLTCVFTVRECIKKLSNEGPWDVVSLDHDLNFEEFVDSNREDCGMEVVRWLLNYSIHILEALRNLDLAEFIIHTSNRAAGLEMEIKLLDRGFTDVRYERFTYD